MTVPLFQISSITSIAQDAIDTLLIELGKPCRLIYPPVMQPCPNGCPLPVGAKQTTDVWRSGTTVRPSTVSVCPVCGGSGQMAVEQTETLTLLCNFNPKEWFLNKSIGPQTAMALRIPDGYCITKGFLSDAPKIQRCNEAVLATNVEPYLRYRYKLDTEPIDNSNIIQSRYFTCGWVRSG